MISLHITTAVMCKIALFIMLKKHAQLYTHLQKNAKRLHIGTLHSLYSWSNSNRADDSFKKRSVGVAVAFEAESTK